MKARVTPWRWLLLFSILLSFYCIHINIYIHTYLKIHIYIIYICIYLHKYTYLYTCICSFERALRASGRDVGKDRLNSWLWWLQTPLSPATGSSPLPQDQLLPGAGSRRLWKQQSAGAATLEGRFKAFDQATPAAVSKDTALAGPGMSLGFALAAPVNPGGEGLWERRCPPRSPAAGGCPPH